MDRQTVMSSLMAIATVATIGVCIYAIFGKTPVVETDPLADDVKVLQSSIASLQKFQQGATDALNELQSQHQELLTTIEKQNQPTVPPPKAPEIRAEQIDGADLAELLDLSMFWKFSYDLLPGEYTIYLWVEKWRRGVTEPVVDMLVTESGTWSEGSVLFQIPTENDNQLYARIDIEKIKEQRDSLVPSLPFSPRTLDAAALQLDRTIHLVTFVHNESEPTEPALSDVHHKHDETIYINIGFTRGAWVPFDGAQWVGR